MVIPFVLTAVISYLLGSVNFAIVVSRLYAHDDVRRHGSGNAGMTNILRTYGKLPAFFTFLGDFCKGWVAVLIGEWLFSGAGKLPFDPGYVAALFVLLGHLFPVYFGFKGGKGVLTTLGTMLIVNPVVFLILLALLLPVLFIFKIVSLVSVLGAVLYPFLTWGLCVYRSQPPFYDTLFAAVFALLVLYMHRGNIRRLLNGTEARFGQKK